jgi:hypothetical protein
LLSVLSKIYVGVNLILIVGVIFVVLGVITGALLHNTAMYVHRDLFPWCLVRCRASLAPLGVLVRPL